MGKKKTVKTTTLTYVKQMEANCLYVTLHDLGIDDKSTYSINGTSGFHSIATDLVSFTPTKQSHLGKKFAEYTRLNNHTTENFLQRLFNGLGISDVYLFKTYTPKKAKKNDLRAKVTASKGPMIIARCDCGVKESIYMGVRNSVAHGNIVYDGKFFVLYSVDNDKNEYFSEVTFFLKIDKLTKLKAFMKSIEAYS